jgi:hypothetical protein
VWGNGPFTTDVVSAFSISTGLIKHLVWKYKKGLSCLADPSRTSKQDQQITTSKIPILKDPGSSWCISNLIGASPRSIRNGSSEDIDDTLALGIETAGLT